MDGDFLEVVKRHVLSLLQLWGHPSITHAVPGAAYTGCTLAVYVGTAAWRSRTSPGTNGGKRVSWIVSFAGTGGLASSRVRLCFFVSGEGNQATRTCLWCRPACGCA